MNRHLRWLVPALCAPAIFAGCAWAVVAIEARPGFQTNVGLIFAAFALSVVALAGPVIAAVLAITRGAKMWRAWLRANGHYTPAEKKARVVAGIAQAASTQAWNAACILRTRLINREVPAPITVWEVVPGPGEVMFYDLPADYSRYYGQDVTYRTSGGFFYGHPAFVFAGVAASAIGNAARRNAAQAQAQTQWRDWQQARVVVTNQRLICWAGGRWLSFYYSGMTAVYPEVNSWTLVCEFGDQAVPLRIIGVNVPIISVMTLLLTHGPAALVGHPSLQHLAAGDEHLTSSLP